MKFPAVQPNVSNRVIVSRFFEVQFWQEEGNYYYMELRLNSTIRCNFKLQSMQLGCSNSSSLESGKMVSKMVDSADADSAAIRASCSLQGPLGRASDWGHMELGLGLVVTGMTATKGKYSGLPNHLFLSFCQSSKAQTNFQAYNSFVQEVHLHKHHGRVGRRLSSTSA